MLRVLLLCLCVATVAQAYSSEVCPSGDTIVTCIVEPCKYATCSNFPNAVCSNSYCSSNPCSTVWRDASGVVNC